MSGPQQERLRRAVHLANSALVDTARSEWHDGARLLEKVALALEGAAPNIRDQIGETGKAAAVAFRTVSSRVHDRAQEMAAASEALRSAHGALVDAETLQAELDRAPLTEPTRPPSSPGASTPEDIRASQRYDTERAAYESAAADREARARAAADRLDAVYGDSTATMKKVHGEPDPAPVPSDGGDGPGDRTGGTPPGGTPGGRDTGGGRTTPTVTGPQPTDTGTDDTGTDDTGTDDTGTDDTGTDDTGTDDTGTDDTGTDDPSGPDVHTHPGDDPLPPGSSQGAPPTSTGPSGPVAGAPVGTTGGGPSTGTPAPAAGGLTGAVGGGALGGLTGISGAVRGPAGGSPASSAGSSTPGSRTLGSTARTGSSGGALGRSSASATGTGAGAGARAGAAGAARGASGSRGSAGGRGTAGSRGTAGGRGAAGGQGGRTTKDPRKKNTDFFEEEQDWVDDEGAAPGVID